MYLVEVVLPLPLHQTFSYLSDRFILPGVRCIVPFRNSRLIGIVLNCELAEENLIKNSPFTYKEVEEVIDKEPIVPPKMFPFFEWVANYYLCALGLVYKIALPSGIFSLPKKRIFLTSQGKEALKKGDLPEVFSLIKTKGYEFKSFLRKTKLSSKELQKWKKQGLIEIQYYFPEVKIPTEVFIKLKPSLSEEVIEKNEILRYINRLKEVPEKILKNLFSSKEVNKLIKKGFLERVEYLKMRKIPMFMSVPEKYVLTPLQRRVFLNIKERLDKGGFYPILLFGVTGSGKSLIYLEAIKEVLNQGKKVLVLVPEIALTTYMEMLLLKHFKTDIAVLHSGLSAGERFREWQRIVKGEVKIVVGARSAIFAPIEGLGLIVVDEEHDPSYKEETLPCKYNARDLALVRGSLENIPVILGSATPSIKTFYKAVEGKYDLLVLKERPYTQLPEVRLIKNPGFKLITSSLKKAIDEEIAKGKSVFLYLNRRGYAPLVRCEDCHHLWGCPNCGIPLTYHKEEDSLLCHYCGFEFTKTLVCPVCKGTNLKFYRAGTERVEEELRKIFPEVEIIRLDRDSINTEKKFLKIMEKIYQPIPKIIVGTQMGVHGHNFPGVSLVGVLRAEEGLFIPSYKAAERTFHLLTQAAGRAGRKTERGKVFFQTSLEEHYVIKYALTQDYESFYKEEIALRKAFLFPPFVRLTVIRVEGIKEEIVKQESIKAKEFLEKIIEDEGLEGIWVIGPSPCPFRKLKGFYRWHILIKSESYKKINQVLRSFLGKFRVKGLKITYDIDPEDLL